MNSQKTNFITTISGNVIDAKNIMFLSCIASVTPELDEIQFHAGFEYCFEIFFKNSLTRTFWYKSIDDCEEDYWKIRNAILTDTDENMLYS